MDAGEFAKNSLRLCKEVPRNSSAIPKEFPGYSQGIPQLFASPQRENFLKNTLRMGSPPLILWLLRSHSTRYRGPKIVLLLLLLLIRIAIIICLLRGAHSRRDLAPAVGEFPDSLNLRY